MALGDKLVGHDRYLVAGHSIAVQNLCRRIAIVQP